MRAAPRAARFAACGRAQVHHADDEHVELRGLLNERDSVDERERCVSLAPGVARRESTERHGNGGGGLLGAFGGRPHADLEGSKRI